jgi:hypothetical protein
MKTKLIAALLVAVSASIAAPAFASGYGNKARTRKPSRLNALAPNRTHTVA